MILVIGTISLILKTLIVQSLFLFYDSRVRTFFWTFFIKITSVYLAKFIVDSTVKIKNIVETIGLKFIHIVRHQIFWA